MSKFEQITTGIVVSVADHKDHRFAGGWKTPGESAPGELDYLDSWKVADLKAYAEEQGIDLDGATKKADILAVIADHASDAEVEETEEDPEEDADAEDSDD